MKTPAFWKSNSLLVVLLLPLSALYALYLTWRQLTNKKTAYTSPIPVICVGNIVAGGAGKSPTAISITKLLIKKGKKPVFVSKGYGGNFIETMLVDPTQHNATLVGDEPLLLAQTAACVVCFTREEGCKLAEQHGDVIILDDGLHDTSINKQLTLLIIDGEYGFGNGFLLPAGPLRETIAQGIKHADIAVIIGDDIKNCEAALETNIPVTKATFAATNNTIDKKVNYIAFAGIGRPEKFFNQLKREGFSLLQTFPFADHHPYKDDDIATLRSIAKAQNATLITTSKDMMRIDDTFHEDITTFPIEVMWENTKTIEALLKEVL